MLTLKNPFARSTPQTEPAMSSATATDRIVKRWELEQGRTRKRVEELTSQRDTARCTFADAKQAYGEREIDGVDTSEAEAAMQRADGRVRALEVALTIAKQKDAAAQAELNHAKRQASIDAEATACARLRARAAEGEAILKTLRQFALALAADQKALGAIRTINGTERRAANVSVLTGQLLFSLQLALAPGTGTEILAYGLRTYTSWSECVEKVCGSPPT